MRGAAPEQRMCGRRVAEAWQAQQDHPPDMRSVARRVLQSDQPSQRMADDGQWPIGEVALHHEVSHAVAKYLDGVLEIGLGRQPEPEQVGKDEAVVTAQRADLLLPV